MTVPNRFSEEKQAINDLYFGSAALLNNGRFQEWVSLFSDNARYELLFRSAELGGVEDYLMRYEKNQLLSRVTLLPHYVSDTAKRLHVVSNIRVALNGNSANGESSLVVYRTTEDGRTGLYAVGLTVDKLIKIGERWLFSERRVVLDTRMLEVHTHMPL